ncbi:hypothetical protein BB934_28315 (plasmid) [Microvirga ossetica]|uniref:Uncharacterized protein n=1 Tax=Microvirga ossetica TaxID=1882682 RepID=A0A1B2EQK6_9HYPH|nr:hypothetical protein [Microvirga ossetica]ANY82241.1 hypothetical protein BB934_28315 [Microvirga ossetica]
MQDEVYSDGIAEITITGPIVRIDLMSLSPAERDANNNPKPAFRQRIVMPVDAFANSVELMQRVVKGLIEAGAIKPNSAASGDTGQAPADSAPPNLATRSRNFSPNFTS